MSATFRVKPVEKLNVTDFEQSALWAGYYEPDDVEAIVSWGIPEDTVRASLDAVGWKMITISLFQPKQ